MKKLVLVIFLSLLISACSGGSSTSSADSGITVSVTPTVDAVLPGSVRTVYSYVYGAMNPAVTWSTTCGTLDSANGYTIWTAPASFETCKVTATSTEDTSKKASAILTVTAANVRLSNIPMQSTLYKNQPLVIQSILWGSTNTAVTWSKSGGTLRGTGREVVFSSDTAGTYTVTATSISDPAKSATTTIVVTGNEYPATARVNLTLPVDCTATGSGLNYNVTSEVEMDTVPWSNLGAGDTVRIHPGVYHKQILISTSGTESQPIRICGVPDAAGNLPELNGVNATAVPHVDYNASYSLQGHAGILIYKHGNSYYGGATYPKNIIIEGLKITGFNPLNTFTDTYTGLSTSYISGAAAIRVQHGANIVIRGNQIDSNGNGLFAMSKDNVESSATRNMLVEGNYISKSGVANSYREHQSYLQVFGLVVQGNYYGFRLSGSGGQLKTRAVQQYIRYNYFKSAPRILDLVEVQDSSGFVFPWVGLNTKELVNTSKADVVANYEAYQNQYVYGNIIENTSTAYVVHGAADSGSQDSNPGGILHFYHNTVRHAVPSTVSYRAGLIDFGPYQKVVSSHAVWPTARLSNNAIYVDAGIGKFFLNRYMPDRVVLDKNWISTSWGSGDTIGGDGTGIANIKPSEKNVWQYGLFSTQVIGINNLLIGAGMPFDSDTYAIVSSSPLKSASTTLPKLADSLPPLMEYNPNSYLMSPRFSTQDIGAVSSK